MASTTNQLRRVMNRRSSGSFVPIPHDVIHSESYARLSPKAVKLLLDLAGQLMFRGGKGSSNNGDLCAAFTLMATRGWNSKNTLTRAREELESAGFIEVTQKGGRNVPTLYAVTWHSIDEIRNKPWIKSTRTPSRKWTSISPVDRARSPPTFFLLTPDLISVVPIFVPIAQKIDSLAPKIDPIRLFLLGGVGAILGHLYRSTICSSLIQTRIAGHGVQKAHCLSPHNSRFFSS